jgi:hypothetical protein
MSDIGEKVKEKANDVKDKVINNTKDVIGATKESFSSLSSSSITPNPAFISPSVTYGPNTEENNSDIEVKKVDSPLMEHSESEQKVFSTNIKDNELVETTPNTIPSFDSAVTKNQQNHEQQQQYDYKENNEFFSPFMMGIKLWQNYYHTWMNFYTGVLESFNRTIRNI